MKEISRGEAHIEALEKIVVEVQSSIATMQVKLQSAGEEMRREALAAVDEQRQNREELAEINRH